MPAPDAITDNYSITEDQLLVGSANGFLNNDSDPDGDRLSIILIDGRPFSFGTPITLASGANLTINADGSFQYDQNGSFTYLSAGQTVNDIFTYTISDGRFGFDTSAVCVTISGVTVDLPVAQSPSLNITKAVSSVTDGPDALNGAGVDGAGDVINYTITVQNTGNTTLTGVVVTDPNATTLDLVADAASADGELDVGETWTYTATHLVTQAEIDGNGGGDGDIDNTATADSNQTGEDTADAAAPITQAPALNITKAVSSVTDGPDALNGAGVDGAGDVINYTITVQNTGSQTLTGVVVTDPNATTLDLVADAASADGELDVGETWTYTATHLVTQAEIDGNGGGDGDIDNTATADSNQTGEDTADAAAPITQAPALNITKAVSSVTDGPDALNGAGVDGAGDVINYTITVQNTGSQTLTGVVVTDPNATTLDLVADAASADGELDVGETWTYTATHLVTQAEIDGNGGGDGDIDNTATADSNQTGEDTADAAAPITQAPALNITKAVSSVTDGPDALNGAGVDGAGDVINYTITVQNTGNTTLTGVVVTDPNATTLDLVADAASADGELDVGETWTYTATHLVTQAEIDGNGGGDGDIDNTATADSNQTGEDTADAAAPITQAPALNITKAVSSVTDGPDALNGAGVDGAGDVINYTITVQNTGSQTLTGVVVTDPNATTLDLVADAASADGELDVGETWTYTATHLVTQAEIDGNGGGDGDIDNTATADSNQTGEDTADAAAPITQAPALNITKAVSSVTDGPDALNGAGVDGAGDVINYTITVQNTGSQTLTGVVVTDPNATTLDLVADAASADGELDVGETWTYTATHLVTQAEIDGNGGGDGDIDNTATADSNQTGEDTADAAAPITQAPALNITKAVSSVTDGPDALNGAGVDGAGDVINYTITVQNTGSQTLTGVVVTDPNATTLDLVADAASADGELDVGETWTYTATHLVTQAEIDGNGGGDGDIDNTATADSNQTGEDTADAAAPITQAPALNITKAVSSVTDGPDALNGAGVDGAGDVINYTITVQNTGSQTLTGVVVTDPNATTLDLVADAASADGELDVGETWTYTATHLVTQAEIDGNGGGDGDIDNTATADSAETDPVSDDATVPVVQAPALNIVKDADVASVDSTGDTITYTYTVTNTGNAAIANVVVTDDNLTPGSTADDFKPAFSGGDTDGDSLLDVGETWTYTAVHTVTQAEIDAGADLVNVATATGTGVTPDSDDATVAVDDIPNPVLEQVFVDEDFLPAGHQDLPVPSPGDGPGGTSQTDTITLDFGADAAGATISFAALNGQQVFDTLSAAVQTSATNSNLFYFWDDASDTLYASADITNLNSAIATTAFKLQITDAPTGAYTFTLLQALEHAPGSGATDNTEDPNIVLSLTYTATDGDGDSAPGTISVTIDDDMPLPIAPRLLFGSNVAETSATAFLDSDNNIDNNVGADQLGTVRFPASLNPDSGLTSGGVPIIYTVSSDGLVLTGTAGGKEIFTITLKPDGSFAGTNDAYTLNMSGIVDTESTINFDEATHDFTGGNTAWAGFVPNGQQSVGGTPVPDGSDDLLLTPAGVGTTINGNANAAGVSGGSGSGLGIGSGEAIRLDYVNDLTGNPAGSGGYNDPVNRDHVFTKHYDVNGAAVSFGGINVASAAARFTAIDDPGAAVTDGTVDPVTSVTIRFGGETEVIDLASPPADPVMVGGHAFTISQEGASVIVGGLVNGASIAIYTADGFNSLEVAYVSGNPFLITGFGTTSVLSAPVSFNVPVEVVDADGDAAAAALRVALLPPGAPELDLDASNNSAGGSDYTSTFTIGGSAVPIADIDVLITDPDSTSMASATISMIANGQVPPPNDTLLISGSLPGGITASAYNPATGVLVLTGVASKADYQTALHQVVFRTTDTSTADRIISVTVNDGANTSNTAQTFMHVSSADVTNPAATVDIAANLLTEPNASSLVTIHFTEPVTGFNVNDLTASGGVLSPLTFQKIDGDTYQATFTADSNIEGTARVILTGAYTDLALNPGITGATDTVDVNTLASTLDATIVTDAIPLGQAAYLTFVDLQNPIFSYAGLYNLDAPGDTFLRDAGFDINPSKEYAVSLEPANGTLIPLTGLAVEGITIHGQPGNQLTVGLELDNDNSIILDQTALTAIIQPNSLTPLSPNQKETTSFEGDEGPNQLFDPGVALGSGADSAENTVNYQYGAAGPDDLTGDNDTDVLNGGSGNDQLLGGAGNDILIYNLDDQKIDGGDGTDVLRSDEAGFGLLNNVGVETDAATGFSVVEVFSNKTNIKNIEVLLITDDAQSNSTAGGLLNLTAKDVLDITDPIDHSLYVLGNPGDVVNLGTGVSAWNDNNRALDANGFYTFTQTFEGINLILKVEHDVVVDTQAIAVTVQNVVGVTVNGTAGNDLIDATHTVAGQPLPTNEEDVIIGDKGRDTISGLGGNDTLNGGANADTMIGGTGNDTYVVDKSGDVVTENSGEGIDTVQSSVTYTLGLNMENLTLTGTSRIDGTGNAANNVITGNGANNVLAGLGGADVINGGGGNDTIKGGSDADTLTGGPGNDTFVLAAVADSIPAAPDIITDFFHGQDKFDFSAIDANTSSSKAVKGDQAFLFAGQNADVVANGVSWFESGSNTIVQADVSGDATADLTITLLGINHHLTASDFIL